jgi:hypothetical protein
MEHQIQFRAHTPFDTARVSGAMCRREGVCEDGGQLGDSGPRRQMVAQL